MILVVVGLMSVGIVGFATDVVVVVVVGVAVVRARSVVAWVRGAVLKYRILIWLEE